jgi:hypothetical protein
MYVKIYSYIESLIDSNNLVTENFQKENLGVPSAATISTDTHFFPHLYTFVLENPRDVLCDPDCTEYARQITFSAKDRDCNTD